MLWLLIPLLILALSWLAIQWRKRVQYHHGPITDHFDGKYFYDPLRPRRNDNKLVIKWIKEREKKEWPKQVPVKKQDSPPPLVEGADLRVSYIGHSSILIQTAGRNIICDPHFSQVASPLPIGPRRVRQPGIKWDDLPDIDTVLITHNHYDHLDKPTVKRLWDRFQPHFVTPLGNDVILRRYRRKINVTTADWNESIDIGNGVIIHCIRVQHWSRRGLYDRNKALWAGFVIETPAGKIFYAGDTGFGEGEHFVEAYEQHGPFRFAAIPIGAYTPRFIMAFSHMNPEEAVKAHRLLGSPPTLSLHHSVFQLTDNAYGEAEEELNRQEPGPLFRVLDPGEHWIIPPEPGRREADQ